MDNGSGEIRWQDDEKLRAVLCKVREELKSQQSQEDIKKLKNFKKVRKK